MKIRWTTDSLRMRITPMELDTLKDDKTVTASLIVNGQKFWSVTILPASHTTCLHFDKDNSEAKIFLGNDDRSELLDPTAEGIYLQDAPTDIRYYIEKDFPCVHPRVIEASEPVTETFEPPAGFMERKMD